MEKRLKEDSDLSKFLKEEFKKEAEMLITEAFADNEAVEGELSDEEVQASYEELKERLIASGVYRFEHKNRKSNFQVIRRAYPLAKTAAIVFLSAVCVMASSLGSAQNRQMFTDRLAYIFTNN